MDNQKFAVKLTKAEIITLLNAINTQMVQWSKSFTVEQMVNAPPDSTIGNLERVRKQLKPMANW